MKGRIWFVVFWCVAFVFVGCGQKATPTPVVMEATRVVEKLVTQIVEKVVTATPLPVLPTATATPAPTLTPTLSEVQVLSTAVARLSAQVAGQVVQVQAAQVLPVTVTVLASVPVTQSVTGTGQITGTVAITGAIQYPPLVAPDPARQSVFPDVPFQGRPALARYETPFEDGDYFEAGFGDVDLPQWYYRIISAGRIKIPELGIDCEGSAGKGCAVVLVNHYGSTSMWRRTEVDNGFTVAGLVFDMGSPEKVTLAAQALTDHVVYRMTVIPNPGANCSTQNGCPSVEWYVVVVGDGKSVARWTGLFRR